jgi:hypothetical protein
LKVIYPLWFEHLSDNIFSVREDAAIALGCAVRAYGHGALDRVLPKLRCAACATPRPRAHLQPGRSL